MAERRMFAKTIIDSDAFLDMPTSAQALYFHMAMRADDDGFLNNPKKVQRMVGASDDDCKLLLAKRFIIAFDTGVVVIKHWRIHNYIQKDRYKETVYQEEKRRLEIKENGAYSLMDTECIQDGYALDTQVSIGKDSIDKDRLGKDSISPLNPPVVETVEIPFSGEMREAFDDWLAYKKEKRQPYKPRGLKSLITQTKGYVDKYGDGAVIGVIRDSMASNYQGIMFERLSKLKPVKQEPKQYTTKGSFFDDE